MKVWKKYNTAHGGAVVLDPKTGRIIALAGVSNSDRSIDPGVLRTRSNIPASMFEPIGAQPRDAARAGTSWFVPMKRLIAQTIRLGGA